MLRRALVTFRFVEDRSEAHDWIGQLADRREAIDSLGSREASGEIERTLDALDEGQRWVLTMRYGLGGESPMSYRELGLALGYTREWARKEVLGALGQLARSLSGTWMNQGFAFTAGIRGGRLAEVIEPRA
jgi:DNA-directed RNA polymerase sigma subunit (sigma70/sigma32)